MQLHRSTLLAALACDVSASTLFPLDLCRRLSRAGARKLVAHTVTPPSPPACAVQALGAPLSRLTLPRWTPTSPATTRVRVVWCGLGGSQILTCIVLLLASRPCLPSPFGPPMPLSAPPARPGLGRLLLQPHLHVHRVRILQRGGGGGRVAGVPGAAQLGLEVSCACCRGWPVQCAAALDAAPAAALRRNLLLQHCCAGQIWLVPLCPARCPAEGLRCLPFPTGSAGCHCGVHVHRRHRHCAAGAALAVVSGGREACAAVSAARRVPESAGARWAARRRPYAPLPQLTCRSLTAVAPLFVMRPSHPQV